MNFKVNRDLFFICFWIILCACSFPSGIEHFGYGRLGLRLFGIGQTCWRTWWYDCLKIPLIKFDFYVEVIHSFIRMRINHILLFLFTIKWVTTKKRSRVWRSRPRLTLENMNTIIMDTIVIMDTITMYTITMYTFTMDTSIMDTSIMDKSIMDKSIMDTIMDTITMYTSIIMKNRKRLSQLTLLFRFIISVMLTLTWSVSSLPTLSQIAATLFF